MSQRKWTQEQIIGILKQMETGCTVIEVCRENGVGESTYYKWKRKYSGLEVNEARGLKALEDGNARVKRIVAEQALDIVALKDALAKKLVTPAAPRQASGRFMQQFGLWQRQGRNLVCLQCCSY